MTQPSRSLSHPATRLLSRRRSPAAAARRARSLALVGATLGLAGALFTLPAGAQAIIDPPPPAPLQTPQQASESAINKLVDKGNFGEALAKIDEHLKQYPRDAQVRFTRGRVLMEMGRNAEAIDAFTALTQDFPELPEPYNNLAALYAQAGEYDKARAALESAIRNNPGFAVAYSNLGDVYAKLAQQAYQKSLKLAPTARVSNREKILSNMLAPQRAAPVSQAPSAPKAGDDAALRNVGKSGN
ncbi:tetratricopeptide repeat protein [Pandoraea nosoerga]|uniref:Tetratricopeptide repeat protein n=1 Tax=Pandoraea nosoerga TaxID=2508296 RepID=A0A5E4TVL8_9BURK|nr:tetratricopeptide repeat protein [Pandoraea nosoerga]MBN4665025.1 tetratricopeptide repeat protein [Pandoraea nosoerga]MBN4675259.1 tetratricopeptide repeat protein [Pandoraea nosoerga]MBN4680768.1 tetratricopeptide repeat protein [Pandoraea nosoerga]MBN4744770.1 tetratricopeptide repeat protein [Pandoraea nosoerga]VVD91837.1 tetratricopeptide repeat protein [Pandoraea nosoerga]